MNFAVLTEFSTSPAGSSWEPKPRDREKLSEAILCAKVSEAIPAPPDDDPLVPAHDGVIESNIGWGMNALKWAERHIARQRLKAQSDHLVSLLAAEGEDLRRETDMFMLNPMTSEVERVIAYRRSRIIPIVAATERYPMLKALKYLMATHPAAKYFRYAVITAGEPVPSSGPMRETIKWLNRAISRWAHHSRKQYGIEILFRGIEFTRQTAAERGMADRFDPDTPLYHVHANIVFWPKRKLPDDQWSQWLRSSRHHFKAHWRDCGRVAQAEEIIKYCFKPDELGDIGSKEMLWLYRDLQRLKIAQPMGPLAALQRDLEEQKLKLATVIKNGRPVLQKIRKSTRCGGGSVKNEIDVDGRARAPRNIYITTTLPQFFDTPWAVPMILVRNPDLNPTLDGDRRRLADIKVMALHYRDLWEKSKAPPYEEAKRIADLYLKAAEQEQKAKSDTRSRVAPIRFTPVGQLSESEAEAGGRQVNLRPDHPPWEPNGPPTGSGIAARAYRAAVQRRQMQVATAAA